MPKREEAESKTYLSSYKDLSLSFPLPNGGLDTLRFINGEFTTVFVDEQEHIEGLPQFASQVISVKPSPRVALEAKAVSLRAAAVEANAVAKAAEDAVKALDEKPSPKAEKPSKKDAAV